MTYSAEEVWREIGGISTSTKQYLMLSAFADMLKQREATTTEPIGWVFQHDETGRMCFCENDGINTPDVFAKNNPRHSFVSAAYASRHAPIEQREAVTWNDNEKYRAFEWLRRVATVDDAPVEAGIALDTWHSLATSHHARQAPDDRLQKAINALIWIHEDVWPLVHASTSRETLRQRFRELPALIEYLAAATPAPSEKTTLTLYTRDNFYRAMRGM